MRALEINMGNFNGTVRFNTLPVGEIANFGPCVLADDSKNVWDHVPIEAGEKMFSLLGAH